jgi:ribose transport system ATP-binding protein
VGLSVLNKCVERAVPESARLTMNGIAKRFGSTPALRGVDLDLRPGEIHALVGENGAGKSTLVKILSGALSADAGHMMLDGHPYRPAGPQEARRRGVAMIYQELTLAPHLTVEANVMLGGCATAASAWCTSAISWKRSRKSPTVSPCCATGKASAVARCATSRRSTSSN